MSSANDASLAAIFGVAGLALTEEERVFFREVRPLGFILFQRNCQSVGQMSKLVADLRESVGRPDAPVLIDQEGGRVVRMKPPVWRAVPSAAALGALYERNPARGVEATWLNARLIAHDLTEVGVSVDCAPVLDLRGPDTHAAIGDRSFGASVDTVTALGRAFAEGLLAGGVLPVIKHVPGHGRATVDSHLDTPTVANSVEELGESDFRPFVALSDLACWAMTAHIIYSAIDPVNPATVSPALIDWVRNELGFDGVIVSDDLSMEALDGDSSARARAVIAAGCDIVLHCNGKLDQMRGVASVAGPLSPAALGRLERAARRVPKADAFDARAGLDRLNGLLAA